MHGDATFDGRPFARAFRSAKTSANAWFQTYLIEFVLRRKALPPSKDGRHVPLKPYHEKPLIDERRGDAYISNVIRTSRYTVYDFFPKQLIFQFTRLGNFYFLCVGVPQMIPGLSTTGSYTTIIPLLIFVLLTIIKEGYDDWRRHRLDKVENARSVTVLCGTANTVAPRQAWYSPKPAWPSTTVETEKPDHHGCQWKTRQWRDLRVGDVIQLTRDEDVPADIVLLHANGENNYAYIETMALDGETNLKSKQVPKPLEGCDTVEGIMQCHAEIVAEDPNPDLFRFEGKVIGKSETTPLTHNEVVYRGCTVRNTPCVLGLVINTGEECKIRRNANRHPPAKKPAVEKIANKIVLSLAFLVICLAVGCSMGYIMWQRQYEASAWYLEDARVPFHEIFIGFIIQFNNIIPLSLYVSLEIVKLGQMWMLNSDIRMYDDESDTPARCNTNTILENLGQIGYVFSDKTGTLTENVMKFRKMSVAGTSWLHDMDIVNSSDPRRASRDMARELRFSLAATREVRESDEGEVSYVEEGRPSIVLSPTSPTASGMPRQSLTHQRSGEPELTTKDLLVYVQQRPHSVFSRRATQYILAVALCHTCLPESRDGKMVFQAASPDEVALVEAAQELGWLVLKRSSRSVTLQVSQGDETVIHEYEILDVIEFSSKRKRMSVVVKCPDGRIWLITKGADSVILPRLRLAHLAMDTAQEVRKSIDLEHKLRQSESYEPRNSFGGRPSLTIRRGSVAGPVAKRMSGPVRTHSFETSSKPRASGDHRAPKLGPRSVSFDMRLQVPMGYPSATVASPLQGDRFSFLEELALDDDASIFARCFRHIDDYATEGLRTLLFAHKYLSRDAYQEWKALYHEAETSLVDREERMEATGELIEQAMDLIGASAIEDKLQKGVPETIDRLRKANIKIWMLTGDKRETAINIAHSARICQPYSDIFILDVAKGDLGKQIRNIQEELSLHAAGSSIPSHTVVVVDGHTLAAMTEGSSGIGSLFETLIPSIDSVICCRTSPAQKALLVRTVRNLAGQVSSTHFSWLRRLFRSSAPLTLAIGDGGNDLAMLSAAHVGVGISGREGLQAARVADYSIAQFRFLSRLLLVHGRWNYVRTSRFILATFWKEMFFYLPTELYQRYNGYTGTSLYESWSLTVLNVLFTSLAVIMPAMWEQDLQAETLLAVPELYVFGQRNEGLNIPRYLLWMVGAVAEGVLVWFICWSSYGGLALIVKDNGLFALGNMVFSVAVMWTNCKLLMVDVQHKNWIIVFSFSITVTGWWAWQGFLTGVYASGVTPYAVRGGFQYTFGGDGAWWFTLLAIFGLLLVMEISYRAAKRSLVTKGLWTFGRKWFRRRTWHQALHTSRDGKWLAMLQDSSQGVHVEEWGVEAWQEIERDPTMKRMLRDMSGEHDDDTVEMVSSTTNPEVEENATKHT